MESLQNIKRRLKGVQNIGQITKAMELVAATKMRRSQEIALASRPYAITALELLGNLSKLSEVKLPPVLEKRRVERTLLVLVTSDKGLAGSFNSAVIRKFEKFLRENQIDVKSDRYSFIAVGQKANRYLEKKIGKVEQKFVRFGDYTTIPEVKPLSDYLVAGYLEKKWDEVIVFSTHFRTALRQEVLMRKIFPVDIEAIQATTKEIVPEHGRFAEFRSLLTTHYSLPTDYIIEPSPEVLLEALVPHLVEMQIYHLILEANASEHAARRLAMKNASDNAAELTQEFTVVYNKARQAGITKELTEISAGAEALS